MERAEWTEKRLDDLAESVRSGFTRNDDDHREMRAEIRQGFAELRTAGQRTNLALIVGLIGVVATILARGA